MTPHEAQGRRQDQEWAKSLIAGMEAAADQAEAPDVATYWRQIAHGARLDIFGSDGLAPFD